MRGNIVTAAAVFGAALLLSTVLLLAGMWILVNRATTRLTSTIEDHGRAVERAGDRAGAPINVALKDMTAGLDRDAGAIEHAGDKISHPTIPSDLSIKMQGGVAVQQPLIIRGTDRDGTLPVATKVGK
ncbi:MAG TPA: hypothetical protein VLJ39_05385 [Tepidisphaeraceae bacterium]|nr:hypothetical protein [Tepidisphaeraceae bacterium]